MERPRAHDRRRASGAHRPRPARRRDVRGIAVVARVRAVDQRRLLGDVLLDQRVVAGIGNMWLAEILWHARLSPWLEVGAADDDELAGALAWGREAMLAIRGGPAARRARSTGGRGRPCPRCGARSGLVASAS